MALLFESCAELWMRDFDKSLCSIAQVFSEQMGDTIFGDNVMDVCPRCDYGSADVRYDSRAHAVFGAGRQGYDGFALFAPSGTADEIYLTAETTVQFVAN